MRRMTARWFLSLNAFTLLVHRYLKNSDFQNMMLKLLKPMPHTRMKKKMRRLRLSQQKPTKDPKKVQMKPWSS